MSGSISPLRPLAQCFRVQHALSELHVPLRSFKVYHSHRKCMLSFQTTPTKANNLPLDGIRVLDMSRVLAGPYCTQILGDLGAEVIKVEHPVRGDDTRAWGPPFAEYTDGRAGPGESAYYLSVNRNKKSLALSFAHPEGVEILHELVKTCDVLVENYLTGSLKKYNMDYETIQRINPRLIYASITGYGQTGPYSNRPGFDVMVEAEFGLMHLTGSRNGPPVKVGVAVTDLTTGLYASHSIMAALFARFRTGEGQHLDVCLSDVQTATLANMAQSVLVSGTRDSGRWGTAHRKLFLDPEPAFSVIWVSGLGQVLFADPCLASVVPYQGFKTADGDIFIGGANDRLFSILCNKLDKPDWSTNPKYRSNNERVQNREELESLIETETMKRKTQEWLDIFEGSGLPYAAVNDVLDTLNHEHTTARGMIQKIDHPACGSIKVLNPPVKYSKANPSVRSPPPLLGEHTEEVLLEVVGLDKERVQELKSRNIIAQNEFLHAN